MRRASIVAYHVSEATFMHPLIHAFGEKELQSRRTGQTAWQWMFCYSEIPVQMTLANLVFNNLFGRFPNLRVISAENGANWLPAFLEKMDKMRGMAKNGYWPNGQLSERPSKIFRRHCYVVAYPEDDVKGIVEKIGGDENILMGSDFPHAEGVPEPRDFYKEALADTAVQSGAQHHARQRAPLAAGALKPGASFEETEVAPHSRGEAAAKSAPGEHERRIVERRGAFLVLGTLE